jgi:hypothetical protein
LKDSWRLYCRFVHVQLGEACWSHLLMTFDSLLFRSLPWLCYDCYAMFSAMFRSLSTFPIVPSVKSGWVDCLAAWLAWELESSRGSWMDTPHPQTVLQDVLQHVGPSFLDFLK